MSEAIARFASFLQLSDQMLARAEREDLEECARILAMMGQIQVGHTVQPIAWR